MPSRKRSQEGRNITSEKKAQAQSGSFYFCSRDSVFDFQLVEVRTQCMLEAKDRMGNSQMVFKHWLGGPAMEEILKVGKAAPIAAGLLEAMKNGMRIEADAQAVLAGAEAALRRAVAEAFAAEAAELSLTCDSRQESLARSMQALSRKIHRTPAEQAARQSKAKLQDLQAVLDRELALGNTKAVALAIAEARSVDDNIQDQLEKLQDKNLELARELAIDLRRRARKINGSKSRFLCALAMRIEHMSVPIPQMKRDERRAA